MSADPPSRHARPDDAETLVSILTEAFLGDPFFAYFVGDPESEGFARRDAVADCMRADVGSYLTHGHTFLLGDRAAAAWTPPGIRADEAPMVEQFQKHCDAARAEAAIPGFVEMGEWRPTEPHFYLHLIGARDRARGQGLGSALLRRTLMVCDAEGTPAYLEASSARSAALYARHGFEQLGSVDFSPGPTLYPMRRPPA